MTPAQRAEARLNARRGRIDAQRRKEFRTLRIAPNVRLRPNEVAALAAEELAELEALDELIWGHLPLGEVELDEVFA